ncbi:ATP-binding cassette domain-containing protein [Caviibacter abscessus]|uniref:ATP-binding cassette domain-containing protein n=1 Tax=Caviibacter abscessus TaxID=1766719 RepID=UPI00082B6D84|nr:ATP-binding cassette domain-containing protein [Caviibacter abscessus]
MEKILDIKKLNVSIDNEHLLKDVSLSINNNEIVGILGESGSGKTLTTKFILGILPERSIIEYENFTKKSSIGAIFQNAFILLNPTVRIGKQLKHLYISHYNTDKGFVEMISRLFKKVGLNDVNKFLNKYPFETSGGERQRIAIAGALIGKPKILIADEITTALDFESKKEVIDLLKDIKDEYGSIIFISHEVSTMKNFVDRIYVMYKGQIIEENITSEIFSNPQKEYTKKLVDLEKKYYEE